MNFEIKRQKYQTLHILFELKKHQASTKYNTLKVFKKGILLIGVCKTRN